MIHTASLVHDDVVDEASTRRGVETVHSRFNYRVAVLAGDFLFAQASWHLANLDNLDISPRGQLIADYMGNVLDAGDWHFGNHHLAATG